MKGIFYPTNTNTWKRPSDWIQTPSPQEDEIIMLYPVRKTDNNFAVKVEGDYIVDWGDGIIEQYDSLAQAEHSYNYDSLDAPLDNTGCKQVIIKIKPHEGNNITFFTLNLTLASGKQNNSIYEFKGNLPYFNSDSFSYNLSSQYLLQNVLFYNLPDITTFRNVFYKTNVQNINIDLLKKTKNSVDGLFRGIKIYKDKAIVDTTKYSYLTYAFSSDFAPEEITIKGDNPDCNFAKTFQSPIIKKIKIEDKLYTALPFYLFYTCRNLTEIEGIENIVVTTQQSYAYMFYKCSALKKIVCDMSNATNATNFISYAYSLQELKLTNIPKINIDIKYSNVTREQFIEIFESLPDASDDDTSPVLTITGCRGVSDLSDDDKAIATDKNWTLVT